MKTLYNKSPRAPNLKVPKYIVPTKNYFTFNNNLYRLIEGTAIGTRMAPSYANMFMKYIEIQLVDKSPKRPKIWLRFIDDIIMIWGHGRNELKTSYT